MGQDRSTPLSAEDWLCAALRALAERGPAAVRAEALARDLKVTKGSFYWHFADMQDFRTRLLTFWHGLAYDRFLEAVATIPDPRERLRRLAHLAVTCGETYIGGPQMEPAMRGWALSDPAVAIEVAKVDDLRRVEIVRLGAASGLSASAAVGFYAAMLGLGQQRDLSDIDRVAAVDALLDGLAGA